MKVKFCILEADYISNKETAIRLMGNDEKGKTIFVLADFEPYFYALPSKIDKKIKKKILGIKEPKVKRIEETERIIDMEKKKLLKVYAHHSSDVPKIRDVIKDFEEIGHDGCYEYSINFYRRYLIDNQFSPGEWLEAEATKQGNYFKASRIKKTKDMKTKLKEMAFDIETYGEGDETKITMISLFGQKIRKVLTYKKDSYPGYVEVLKDEKEMLQRFVKTLKKEDPDVIYGYNSDDFDFKIIHDRAEKLKVKLDLGRDGSGMKFTRRARTSSAEIQGRVHIDLFSFVSNILAPGLQTEVLRLGDVSSEILGDAKADMKLEEIFESWRNNTKKLASYCLKDSELAFRLGRHLWPQILELCKLAGQTPFDVSRMTYSQLVEWYLSRRAFAAGRIIPNQPKFKEIKNRRGRRPYVGGFVKEPEEGLYEGIVVLDFRSLYPTIIASHNISPETLNKWPKKEGHAIPESDGWFSRKPGGFISSVIEDLVKKRLEMKKEGGNPLQERALKIIANATYGYFAFPGSKWYCFECARATASWGRFYIKKIIKEAEAEGFRVVYGDTDSVFLTHEKIKSKTRDFLSKINNSLPGIMELDLQGFYKRGIFVSTRVGRGAKKRYALIDGKGEMTIRGFETVRRDWCSLAKKVQRKVLRRVLEENDASGAASYVREVVENIRQRKVELKDLIIYEQLTKKIKDYEQIGPHVTAAKKMKEKGKPVGPGMVVMFLVTSGSGSISQRAEPLGNVSIEQIDTAYYVNNQIIPAAMRVLGVLGAKEEELKGEGKQTGLKSFGV